MASNGLLNFQGTNKATFVGASSNIALDVVNSSLGIGITGTNPPSSNLYITGNAYVTSDISVGGVLNMGVVNVAARHTLEAITALGASTPSTLTLTNTGTSLVASGDVTVDTNTFHVDTTNNRVGVGTTSPLVTLDTHGNMRSSAPYPRLDFYTTTNRSTTTWGNSTDNAGDYRIYSNGDASDGSKRSLNFDYGQNSSHSTRICINASGNIGLNTTTPKASLHNNGDFFIAANSATWTQTTGKGLYIRYSTNAGQDATYIQSIDRSNNNAYYNMMFYASKYVFNGVGNVGIGTENAHAPLTVYGIGGSIVGGSRTYYTPGNLPVNTGTGWSDYADDDHLGIFSEKTIASRSAFLCINGTFGASDERIKKEIVDINDASALETLRLLKPKQYKYVDEIKRGTEPVWGFIAQEVRDILPYSTQLRTECIPNIYEMANVSDKNVLTFTNFDTSNLKSNVKVKVFDKDDKEQVLNIVNVVDKHSVRVDEDLSDDKRFVYGQQVDDFIYLKKEAIWTVATAALQEVDRQLQAEKEKVRMLEDHLTRFTAQVTARLAALESKK